MNNQPGTDSENDLTQLLLSLKDEDYCYLTTTGRVSGNPHEIEIWFGVNGHTLYLLSGGMDKSDWVKNLLKNPAVTVRIAKYTFTGIARLVKEKEEELTARYRVAEKYQEWENGRTLSEWARTSLVVGIDLSAG
jgi:deazaflavin-dependent oxidoreductase (nitroreductase family)